MKASEILDAALALMFETRQSAADYTQHAPQVLNLLLPELLGPNNQIRRLAGKEPLASAPVVASLEDEVGYEERFCRAVLPWGLAAWLLLGDEEGRAPDYMNLYVRAVNEAAQLVPEEVEDVYS